MGERKKDRAQVFHWFCVCQKVLIHLGVHISSKRTFCGTFLSPKQCTEHFDSGDFAFRKIKHAPPCRSAGSTGASVMSVLAAWAPVLSARSHSDLSPPWMAPHSSLSLPAPQASEAAICEVLPSPCPTTMPFCARRSASCISQFLTTFLAPDSLPSRALHYAPLRGDRPRWYLDCKFPRNACTEPPSLCPLHNSSHYTCNEGQRSVRSCWLEWTWIIPVMQFDTLPVTKSPQGLMSKSWACFSSILPLSLAPGQKDT